MDRISVLPDEFLLRILSLVPTKNVFATMVLSKRWRSLWTKVPRLEYDSSGHKSKHMTFSDFVFRSLLLNKAPVLESLRLELGSMSAKSAACVDLGIWVGIAVERHVCVLQIDCFADQAIRLPSSLYTCETLETLILRYHVIVDVPSPACFKTLKTLHLIFVDYKDDDSACRLLSSFPVLEYLVVARNDKVETFTIAVPSLQRFSARNDDYQSGRFVINAPLKYLNIEDHCEYDCFSTENVPEVVEAIVDVSLTTSVKLLGSLTSVKRLSLRSEVVCPSGIIFYQLVHLELCTNAKEWWNLLTVMLEGSSNLREIKLTNECKERLCISVLQRSLGSVDSTEYTMKNRG